MEFNFDKEIDALLRQTAKGETVFASNDANPTVRNQQFEHLDADEISAFAENALPNKARMRITEHLADCDPCRKTLSNTMLLNAEAETDAAFSAVSTAEPETVAIPAPWYKKLFGFQGLAYGLGALVILFAGFTAFILLQNMSAGNSEISQADKTARNLEGVPSENEPMSATDSDNYKMAANTSTVANSAAESYEEKAESDSNTASIYQNESQDGTISTERKQSVDDNISLNKERNDEASGFGLSKNPAKPMSAATPLARRGLDNKPAPVMSDSEAREVDRDESPLEETADKMSSAESPKDAQTYSSDREKSALPAAKKSKKNEAKQDRPQISGDSASGRSNKTRQAGGKNFRLANGVWYDTAYKNQKTTNVRRGSNDYKNLDSGLRSIAEQFRETVVVVWETKAYRIQ